MKSKKFKMALMALGLSYGVTVSAGGPVTEAECEAYENICHVQGNATIHCQIVYTYCQD
ncbi:MAG: hypothetical protein ACI8WB_002552 [Phenylobacterium sp.]|jgi:hypothetical protein